MFKRTGPNAAESSEGYSVKRLSRLALEYRTGDRRLIVEVEPGDGLAIYRQTITSWETPSGSEAVSAEERTSVLRDICAALDFLGEKYVIS